MKYLFLLLLSLNAFAQREIKDNELVIGTATDEDILFTFDKAGATNPVILWDASEGLFNFSHDGITYENFVGKEYVDSEVTDIYTEIDDHLNDATSAHAASAISNSPSGNLAATNVQTALSELQTDIDTRALDSALTSHMSDTSTHGVAQIANDADVVHVAGTETITGAKTFSDITGIGSSSATVSLNIQRNVTGASTAYSIYNRPEIQSDVTVAAYGFRSAPSTAAAAFTVPSLNHFFASQGTIGAGSDITSQFGFQAASTLSGATSNYGFYGNIPSAIGRWNFYANGTAQSYFNGNVGIGTDDTPDVKLHIKGTSANALVRIESSSVGQSSVTKDSPGLGFIAGGMDTTSKYTPLIKFMSTDSAFTTQTPKMSAFISARATESYAADTDGGMAIDFATSPNDVGTTSVPTVKMSISSDGVINTYQPAVTSKAAAAILTITEIRTRIIQYTGTGDNLQLPTGTSMDTFTGAVTDISFDFSVINTGSGAAVLTTNTDLTLVGSMSVAATTSGSFRARRTGSNTFTIYRLN